MRTNKGENNAPRCLSIEGLIFLGIKCKVTDQNPVIIEGTRCQFYTDYFDTEEDIKEFFKKWHVITTPDGFQKVGSQFLVKHVCVSKENYDKIK